MLIVLNACINICKVTAVQHSNKTNYLFYTYIHTCTNLVVLNFAVNIITIAIEGSPTSHLDKNSDAQCSM